MPSNVMFQVSTLSALSLGYTREAMSVKDLLAHGDTGLGTFTDVNGEMIVVDGRCFRALSNGQVELPADDDGVPFAAVASVEGGLTRELGRIDSIDALKQELDIIIEEWFGLNFMHIARIDGVFSEVYARSEDPTHSMHVSLKDLLVSKQQDFRFESIAGTLVCVYYPQYLDGVNAPGWHLHFISEDRSCGGHVFGLSMESGTLKINKLVNLEIQLPQDPGFDTYALHEASQNEIRQVELGAAEDDEA